MFAALITNSDAVKSAIRREVRRVADVVLDSTKCSAKYSPICILISV